MPVVLLIVIIILLILLYKYYSHYNNLYVNFPFISDLFSKEYNPEDVDIIIAHYKEDLSWVDELDRGFNVYIYSKGGEYPNVKRPFIHRILPNVGRESHTFLTHFVDNYDNLNKYNVTLIGSVMENIARKIQLYLILKNLAKHEFYSPFLQKFRNPDDWTIDAYRGVTKGNWDESQISDPHQANGTLDEYSERSKVIKGKHKVLKDWIDDMLPHPETYEYICHQAMFSVTRDRVHKYPKSFYERFIPHLSIGDNILAGHFMEQSHAHLFYEGSFPKE